jgi:hypothetical protein
LLQVFASADPEKISSIGNENPRTLRKRETIVVSSPHL